MCLLKREAYPAEHLRTLAKGRTLAESVCETSDIGRSRGRTGSAAGRALATLVGEKYALGHELPCLTFGRRFLEGVRS